MKKSLLIAVLFIWLISDLYAQSDTHVTVTATLLEVYSNVHDGTHKRHRWRLWAAIDNKDYGSEYKCDIDSRDRGEWWVCNRELLNLTDLDGVPTRIKIRFYGYEKENGGGKQKERTQEYSFPIDFPEGSNKEVVLQLDTEDYAEGLYQARINLRYTIPKPISPITTSNTLSGSEASNFCESRPIHLYAPEYVESQPGLEPTQFRYVWEYRYKDNGIFECNPKRNNTQSPCYDSEALIDLDEGNATSDNTRDYRTCDNYLYDTNCYECECEEIDGYWYEIDETDDPEAIWTAARQGNFDKVAFRYRLKHISNGAAGPPSDPTGYVTIYDPPPVLDYTDNTGEHYSQAADATYDNGDLHIGYVRCKDDTDGTITIKNLDTSSGREYFYNLKGPVPANSTSPTAQEGGRIWNINGQGLPTPRSTDPSTWLTFPNDDPDHASNSPQLQKGTYWLVIENWDRRDPNTDNELENLDIRACYVARKITVKEPADSLKADFIKKEYEGGMNVSCYEASNGEITINATGGIAPYRYFLRENEQPYQEQSEVTFSNLAAHQDGAAITYQYYVTDAMGCTTPAKSFTLNFPSRLTVDYALPENYYPPANGPYHIQCFGGTDAASIQASGGVPPYSITIDGTTHVTNDQGDVIVVNDLSANQDYEITVTDRNGCTATSSVRLNEPDPLALAEWQVTPPACAGGDDGSIFLRAKQGIPEENAEYTYTIRHSNVPAALQQVFEAEQTHTGTTALFEYLIEGTYEITIQDRYCIYDTTLILTAPPPLRIAGGVRPVTCQGDEDGSLWAAVSGGTPPYRLDYGSRINTDTLRTVTALLPDQYDSLFALSSQPYWVRATDANGCQTEWNTDVRSPRQPLSLTIDTLRHVSPISCSGAHDGRVQLTATGGWTDTPYRFGRHRDSLQAGQPYYRNLGPGQHTFYVQDHWGCLDSVVVTLREPDPLSAAVASVQHLRCYGQADGSIALDVQGGTPPYRASIDRGTSWREVPQLNGLAAGAYELWIADARDCQAPPLVVTLDEPPLLTSQVTRTQDTRCGLAEGAATVSVTGGVAPYQVTWYNEAQQSVGTGFSIGQLSSGQYTAIIQDANRCANELTVTISDRDGPVVQLIETQPVRCAGGRDGSATISVAGGTAPLTIRWDDGQDQPRAVNLSGGEHRVEVQDANGCRVFLTVPIGEPFPLEVITEQQTHPVCSGESNGQLSVIAQGGNGNYRYAWGTGATARTLTDLPAGDYVVTVTDEQGCQARDTLRLIDPEPIAPTLPDTLLLCYGQQTTLDAGYPGSAYAWESTIGLGGQAQTLSVVHPGTYRVTVTDEHSCQGTAQTEVIYSNELLNAEFLMASEAQTGDTVVLVDISQPTPERTDWHYNDEAEPLANYEVYQELIYDQPGTYEVTLRVKLGACEDEITKSITIIPSEVIPTNGRVALTNLIESFSLTPNPNNGRFTATVSLREAASLRLRLTDLNSKGTVFDVQKKDQANYEVTYDLAHLAAGVYMLSLQVEDELRTQRVVIR